MGPDLPAVFVVEEDTGTGGHFHRTAKILIHIETELETIPAPSACHGLRPGQRTAVVDAHGDEAEGFLLIPLPEYFAYGIHLFQTEMTGDEPEADHVGRLSIHPLGRSDGTARKGLQFHFISILGFQRQKGRNQEKAKQPIFDTHDIVSFTLKVILEPEKPSGVFWLPTAYATGANQP